MSKADGLLLLALAYGVGLLFQHFWVTPAHAHGVVITTPDRHEEFPLNRPRTLSYAGAIGESELQIRDGAIRFVRSPCRHQVCVRAGWQSHSGAVAACVPNRISLSLRGDNPEFDGYSY